MNKVRENMNVIDKKKQRENRRNAHYSKLYEKTVKELEDFYGEPIDRLTLPFLSTTK